MHLKQWTWALIGMWLGGSLMGCGSNQAPAQLTEQAPDPTRQDGIVGGLPTGSDTFGAVGALVTTDYHGRTSSICTATLIAPDVILTAAHCIGPQKPARPDWQLWFSPQSDARLFAKTNPIRVAQTFKHPDYDGEVALDIPLAWRSANNAIEQAILARLEALCPSQSRDPRDQAFWQCVIGLSPEMQRDVGLMDGTINMGDVALALLDTAVPGAKLALLPTAVSAPLWPTQLMSAVGFGAFDTPSAKGQQGQRHAGTVALDGIGQFELQVGFAQSQVAFGDSGGPLFVLGDEALEIVGIASRSLVAPDGCIKGPTLFAKTSAYTPWIRQSLREACRAGVRDITMCKQHPF